MSLRCVFLNRRTLAVTDGTASGRGVGGGGPLVSDQGMRPRVAAGPRAVGPVTFVRMGVGDE